MKSMFDRLLENDGFLNIVHIPTGQLGCAAITTDKEQVRVFIGNPDGSDDHNVTPDVFNRDYREATLTEAQ